MIISSETFQVAFDSESCVPLLPVTVQLERRHTTDTE